MKSRRQINLLYVTRKFPEDTFIVREILELSRYKDLSLKIIAFGKDESRTSSISPELEEKVLYVKPSLIELTVANVVEFVKTPPKYLSLIVLILFGHHQRLVLKFVDLFYFFVGVTLIRKIREFGADHIHAQWAEYPTTVALVLSRFLDVPFTFTAHAYDIYARSMLLKEKISLAKAVITISKFNQDYLRDLASSRDKNKIFLIYLGVNFGDFQSSPRRKSNEPPLILAVGRLVSYKGFSYLVDALSFVRQAGENFKAVIIGGGSEFEELESRIRERDLIENVELLGTLPFEKAKEYFEKADIFVAPSIIAPKKYFDGLPVVLMEAMAAKLPIVATKVSALPEAVKDGENGLLIEEKDPRALAEAIQVLLRGEGLRETFGEAGYKKALRMFDLKENVKRLKQIILEGKG